ncbi:MAG: UDP-N-acetylmuramoyl-L-alanyl-D-glutamate--2,6-diaminopimelate ligase [Lentisphaeria bacterium]|nr:UDP-N-acetylmuramoyl-L-alanyl-D-glutamate--2,6-diaminopimelate ligase [Lentisphaeria bacterium]
MQLRQLLECVPGLSLEAGLPEMDIPAVCCDSRRVTPGVLYAAIPGVCSDGHDFLDQSAAKGAAAVLVSRDGVSFPGAVLRAADTREAYARIQREFAGCPDQELCMLGVTGTNGKTTTAYLMAALAETVAAGGLLSTVEVRSPESRRDSDCTTPDPQTFFQFARQVREEGGRYLAMELSSHALDQSRTGGVRFQAAVFTNLTGDHLDYHKTMERYFAAKSRLFSEWLEGRAVINTDDDWGRKLCAVSRGKELVTFGISPDADCRITEIRQTAEGTSCVLLREGRAYPVFTPMVGKHNLYNLTGAMLAAEVFGVPFGTVCVPAVPGRLEPVRGGGINCFVDYAHTDDALAQVLQALRPLTKGRLITVFGCGGDRDRTKRPRMGRAAQLYSDLAIVTSDNPRSEDPEGIISEITGGMTGWKEYRVEPDRAEAIKLACSVAEPGDCVLIAGKGHENYQEINGVRYAFSDVEHTRNALRRRV